MMTSFIILAGLKSMITSFMRLAGWKTMMTSFMILAERPDSSLEKLPPAIRASLQITPDYSLEKLPPAIRTFEAPAS